MIETEVKVLVESLEPIRRRLKFLGFEKVRCTRENDIYYNDSEGSFSRTGEILRIRKSTVSTLTYKRPIPSRQTKARVEYNSDIRDPEMVCKILQSLGFKSWKTIIKRREMWKSNGVSVNLDYVRSLGKFVEIEMIGQNRQEISRIEKNLFLTVNQLGLNPNNVVTKSYVELACEK